jgi:hypothetical protein
MARYSRATRLSTIFALLFLLRGGAPLLAQAEPKRPTRGSPVDSATPCGVTKRCRHIAISLEERQGRNSMS